MQCKCGGWTTESIHPVKTIKKAQEWDISLSAGDLPIQIRQDKCVGCNRLHYTVENNKGVLTKEFN